MLSPSGAARRSKLRRLAARAGVTRRFSPHQLRHAIELARERVPLNDIQRRLGHANLGTTSIYLQRIDPEEIIAAVRTRRAPIDGLRQRPAPALNQTRAAEASPGASAPPCRSECRSGSSETNIGRDHHRRGHAVPVDQRGLPARHGRRAGVPRPVRGAPLNAWVTRGRRLAAVARRALLGPTTVGPAQISPPRAGCSGRPDETRRSPRRCHPPPVPRTRCAWAGAPAPAPDRHA